MRADWENEGIEVRYVGDWLEWECRGCGVTMTAKRVSDEMRCASCSDRAPEIYLVGNEVRAAVLASFERTLAHVRATGALPLTPATIAGGLLAQSSSLDKAIAVAKAVVETLRAVADEDLGATGSPEGEAATHSLTGEAAESQGKECEGAST